jgi:hypothetical protein
MIDYNGMNSMINDSLQETTVKWEKRRNFDNKILLRYFMN